MRIEQNILNALEYKSLGIGTYKSGKDGLWPRYESGRFTFYIQDGDKDSGHEVGAWSYNWWQFVRMSKDRRTLVFNDASYSMQTRQHQSMAKRIIALMRPDLNGVTVKTVYIKSGLQNLSGEHLKIQMQRLEAIHDNEVKRLKIKNNIKLYDNHLTEIEDLCRLFGIRVPKRLTKKEQDAKLEELNRGHCVSMLFRLQDAEFERKVAMLKRVEATIERCGPKVLEDAKELMEQFKLDNVIQLRKA